MKMILLAAGAAIALGTVALAAGPVLAASKGGPTVAGPSQPIPYAQLDAYMKASPKTRAQKDWWSGQAAATGTSANTSATVSASPSLPADTAPATEPAPAAVPTPGPALPANPPIDNPPSTTVNPPASVTPGAPPSSTPPK